MTDNEDAMIVWIGQSVSPQILKELFGVDDIGDVDRNMVMSFFAPEYISCSEKDVGLSSSASNSSFYAGAQCPCASIRPAKATVEILCCPSKHGWI